MIQRELLLFAVGLCFGIISRIVFVIVTKLEKTINLKVITIIFDILMSGAAVAVFTFILFFFTEGVFLPFILLSSCLGFTLLSLIF